MPETLPYQCLKRKDQRFLKRDSCDTKRKMPLEELEKRNPINEMCFQCSGPSCSGKDEDMKKETKKQMKCTECSKDILNTMKTGLCQPCGTSKAMKEYYKTKKQENIEYHCSVCNKKLSKKVKTGMCLPCFNKDTGKKKLEQKVINIMLKLVKIEWNK